MVSIRCSDWDLYIVPFSLRFKARAGQRVYIHGSPCYFDVAFYQHGVVSHNYLDRTSPYAFTCTSASTPIFITEDVSWKIFSKGVLTWAYRMFLRFHADFGTYIHPHELDLESCLQMVLFNSAKRMALLLPFNTDIWKSFSLHASGCLKFHSLYRTLVLRVE